MKAKPSSARRKGVAIVLVLVVGAMLAVILTSVTFHIVAQRSAARRWQNRLQADWLARSGIELAAVRLLEKQAAFTLEPKDLAPDGKVRVVVEDLGKGVFAVNAEAEVGGEEGLMVARSASRRFERKEAGETIRLQVLAAPENQK